MGLEKAIKYGKEKRKPYNDARNISNSCRNNNSCGCCRQNRLYQYTKEINRIKSIEKDRE